MPFARIVARRNAQAVMHLLRIVPRNHAPLAVQCVPENPHIAAVMQRDRVRRIRALPTQRLAFFQRKSRRAIRRLPQARNSGNNRKNNQGCTKLSRQSKLLKTKKPRPASLFSEAVRDSWLPNDFDGELRLPRSPRTHKSTNRLRAAPEIWIAREAVWVGEVWMVCNVEQVRAKLYVPLVADRGMFHQRQIDLRKLRSRTGIAGNVSEGTRRWSDERAQIELPVRGAVVLRADGRPVCSGGIVRTLRRAVVVGNIRRDVHRQPATHRRNRANIPTPAEHLRQTMNIRGLVA